MTDYRPRQHINRVLAASCSTHSARLVLEVLCRWADFERPCVTATKGQVAEETGLHPDTVYGCFKALKDEGTLKPINNAKGGRGNAVTWQLCVSAQGAAKARAAAAAARQDEATDKTLWDAVFHQFKAAKPDTAKAWLSRLRFLSTDGGVLSLAAPSAFIADHVRSQIVDGLEQLAAAIEPTISRIEIVV